MNKEEELKGQLAERMPGAISAMADAAGFGTGPDAVAKLFKAMENGEVKSAAVLEKFAAILAERSRQGNALAKAMTSTAAEQNRFNNAFSDLVKVFSEGGFDSALGRFFRLTAEAMRRAQPLVKSLGTAFDNLMRPVNALIIILGRLGERWDDIAGSLGMTSGQLSTLLAVIGIALLPFGQFAVAAGAIALAVEDIIAAMEGRQSIIGDWLDQISQDKLNRLIFLGEQLKALGTELSDLSKAFGDLGSGIGDIFGKDGVIGAAFDLFVMKANAVVSTLRSLVALVKNLAEGNLVAAAGNFRDAVVTSLAQTPAGAAVLGGDAAKRRDELLGYNIPTKTDGSRQATMPGPEAREPISLVINAPINVPQGSSVLESPETFQKFIQNELGTYLTDAMNDAANRSR